MNVLAVFAHPDDEVLGCGGTLAKHAEAGDKVQVLSVSFRDATLPMFHEAVRALGVFGASNHPHGGMCASWSLLKDGDTFKPAFEDQRFDTYPLALIADRIRGQFVTKHADIIYTHHPGDLNLDHALTAKAVLTAFRPKPGERPRTILACEVLSSTEWTFPQQFQPNWFEKLTSNQVGKKVSAMHSYPSEVQPEPHPRNGPGIVKAARYRGQQVGVDYAEAFQLLRRSC